MTRREKIIDCLEGIEQGQIKLQEHIQSYGTSGMSELLYWLCIGIRLLLEKELRNERRINMKPETKYVWFFGRRLIFRDGKYHGWYNPRKKNI